MGLQAHQGHKGKNSEEGWSRQKRTDKCAGRSKDAMREKRELTKEETESEETENGWDQGDKKEKERTSKDQIAKRGRNSEASKKEKEAETA